MSYFFKNKYMIIIFTVTILIFVVMIVSNGNRNKTTFVEDIVATVLSPVQKVFFNTGKNISDFFQFLKEIKTIKKQNESLILEIEKFKEENRKLQNLKEENDRFRKMLDLKYELDDLEMIGAQVISKQSNNWFDIFTIDKGIADNINKNDTVITEKGLVGHIFEISKNSAKVISVIDSNSAVAAIITRTRDFGMVKGDLLFQKEGLCKMIYLNKDADVVAGDAVETSGLGGIYPKGLFIGKIKDIREESDQVSKIASIEPAVDFKSLEYVFVVK